jgi:hypothetical protein
VVIVYERGVSPPPSSINMRVGDTLVLDLRAPAAGGVFDNPTSSDPGVLPPVQNIAKASPLPSGYNRTLASFRAANMGTVTVTADYVMNSNIASRLVIATFSLPVQVRN